MESERYSVEKALQEAESIRERIDLGDALDYSEAEKQVEDDELWLEDQRSTTIEETASEEREYEGIKIVFHIGAKNFKAGHNVKYIRCTAYNDVGTIIEEGEWQLSKREYLEHEIARMVLNHSPLGDFKEMPDFAGKIRAKKGAFHPT